MCKSEVTVGGNAWERRSQARHLCTPAFPGPADCFFSVGTYVPESYYLFLDVVELSSTNAEGVERALVDRLTSNWLSLELLRNIWVGFGADGASVMLGKSAVSYVDLKPTFLRTWHCFNHRLELSVADAIKCCTEVNHFKAFLDLLYSTYSISPKLQRELSSCANDLKIQLNIIGRVFDVRWVASSSRTVKAVWKSYYALHKLHQQSGRPTGRQKG